MYDIKDLFDLRSVFSAKLEQIMEAKFITKANLCKEAGLSRPTLDKLLNAEITSETNFEKHVTKILNVLHLTPDLLMGNTPNIYNRMRQMRNTLHISEESISAMTGISLARLKEIEQGAKATTAELRDIAYCFSTSVRGLLGTNFFDVPFAEPYYLTNRESCEGISGFWGHVGILASSGDQYVWYPINSEVRDRIYNMLDQQFMVIPCMNNKLLLLNMDAIDNIVLLDEACDPPGFANWDPSVSEGEIPLVVYESLDDYFYMENMDEPDEGLISPKFQEILREIVAQEQWGEMEIISITEEITIYYKSSKTIHVINRLWGEDTLTYAIQTIFEFGELDPENKIVYFSNDAGEEIIINLNNISMMELPLLEVEDIICRGLEAVIS